MQTLRWQILELSDKDFKTAIIKMLQWTVLNMLEPNENIGSFSKRERKKKKALNKELENIKKNQMETLDLKIQ